MSMFFLSTSKPKVDFSTSNNDWYVVNDGVMGGRSNGQVSFNEQSMIFKGTISLENNGGFSWVRSPLKKWNLEDYSSIKIRFKSNSGRKFGFTLEPRSPWYMPRYRYAFKGKKGEWTTVELPISDFNQTRVGELTGKKISIKAISKIRRFGIILYDKKAGDFELEVDYIELVK